MERGLFPRPQGQPQSLGYTENPAGPCRHRIIDELAFQLHRGHAGGFRFVKSPHHLGGILDLGGRGSKGFIYRSDLGRMNYQLAREPELAGQAAIAPEPGLIL